MTTSLRSSISTAVVCAVLLTATVLSAAELPKHPEKLSDDRAVDAYLAVVEDARQTSIRRNYATAQIVAMDARAVPRVLRLFRTAPAERRDLLAGILSRMKHPGDEATAVLLDAFRRRRLKTSRGVIGALGALQVAEAAPLLLKLLPQADDDTRLAMLRALSRLADARAADALAAGLDSDDRCVRICCTRGVLTLLVTLKPKTGTAAKDHPYRRLFDRTTDIIRHGARVDVRRMLVTGLAEVNDPRATTVLRRVLRMESGPLQQAAVRSLGRLKDADAVDALLPLIDGRDAALRRAVLDALAEIGDLACVPELIDQLETCSAGERRAVVRTLQRLSGESYGDNPEQWRLWWHKRI